MPWVETEPMNERVKFIAACLARDEDDETFEELCERFCITPKTGYKWRNRYEEHGLDGLKELSRAPHSHPHATDEAAVEALLAARRRHPRWGPRKLLAVVARRDPTLELPVASTVGLLLKKHGLIGKRKRRRLSAPYEQRLGGYDQPNAIWCADFKGHFPVSGERCSPLTITDGFSRYLLRCKALRHTLYAATRTVFESAFQEFGLPHAIRTDNGAPFSTLAPGGLSRLAIWWIHLGIRPERIRPGRPDENGRHERMHLTLKTECCRPPRSSFSSQQRTFDRFRNEYNTERPHEALGQQPPALLYRPSLRRMPRRLPEIEYPAHFALERAYPNGVITFNSTQWYLSGCLRGEVVGLEEVGDGQWRVHFGPIPLGILDERHARKRGSRSFAEMVRVDGGRTPDRRRKRRPYRR